MRIITRNVWILSIVSLFTDVASEMLYPVMPVYLSSIGFSVLLIGILEGCAEATAGLSKGYFGHLSDHRGVRLPFVRFGYAFSAVSKPLMVLFVWPIWVFFARALDKLGKGVRTAARDAMLSDEATEKTKGRVFGFHRSMDTLGAVLGPLLALAYLYYYPDDYRTLFILAFLPGAVAIGFTFFMKEKKKPVRSGANPRFLDFIRYWKESPREYRKLVGALLAFTLFNSSDVFLLLKIKEAGFSDVTVIGAYIFYNLVYALFSYPLGILADKLGMKTVFAGGLLVFALVYAGMSLATNHYVFFGLFMLYGVYSVATEGVAKAWVTNICDKKHSATAIGTYTAFQSVAALIASSMAGAIWYFSGSSSTLLLTAIASVGVFVFVSLKVRGGKVLNP
jgi:MFS family permease